MRIQYLVLTMIGLCVAALGAWLVVSLANEFSGGKTTRNAAGTVASAGAPAADLPGAPAGLNEAGDLAGTGAAGGLKELSMLSDPAIPPEDLARAANGSRTGSEASIASAGKEMDRLERHEPPLAPARILPQEAGPYRAAFIREPPSESEFPLIRLGEANWRVESGADGTIIAELDIVAADQDQRATLRLGGSFAGGDAVFLVTLALGEGEFLPDAGDMIIEAITARGRGDRLVRIPAITLPYEDPKTIDFRVPVEELLATVSFATWFDVGLRIDGARYTITIQNGDATRDILSAVAFGA